MLSCARCDRPVEATRAVYVGGAPYCGWPCAKAESQRLARQSGPARTCGHCGGPISPQRDPRAVWCSEACQRAASRSRLAALPVIYRRSCGLCGAEFTSAQPAAKFCTREHAVAAANARRHDDPVTRDPSRQPAPLTYGQRVAALEVTISAYHRGKAPEAQPDLSAGSCIGHTVLPPDAWIDDDPAAALVCQRCPALPECKTWAMTLPPSMPGTFGALTAAGRAAERRRQRDLASMPASMGKVNAAKDACAKGGHPLAGDNLIVTTDKQGGVHRLCRECHREQVRNAGRLRRQLAKAARAAVA